MQPLQTPQTLWPPPHPLIFIFLLLLTPWPLVAKLVKVVSPWTLPTALGQVLLNMYFILEKKKPKKNLAKDSGHYVFKSSCKSKGEILCQQTSVLMTWELCCERPQYIHVSMKGPLYWSKRRWVCISMIYVFHCSVDSKESLVYILCFFSTVVFEQKYS